MNNCKHLIEKKCEVIYQLSGVRSFVSSSVCEQCSKEPEPCAINDTTKLFASLHSRGQPRLETPWPLLIQQIAKQKQATDIGVGDTLERMFSKFGGRQFKRIMVRLGVECGCGDRQQWLNQVYKYEQ